MASNTPEELAKIVAQKFLSPFNSSSGIKNESLLALEGDGDETLPSLDAMQSLDTGLSFSSKDLYLNYRWGEMDRGLVEKEIEIPTSLKSTKPEKRRKAQTPEMTPELERELRVVKLRQVLDPKRHYKTSDWRVSLPKTAQIGTVVGNAEDFYSARLYRRQQSKGFVDELLRNEKFRKRNKQKYLETQKERARLHKFRGIGQRQRHRRHR